MKQAVVGIVLALSSFAAGCQATTPPYRFSCDNYHAIDAGLCEDREAGRLFGGIVGGAYTRDR